MNTLYDNSCLEMRPPTQIIVYFPFDKSFCQVHKDKIVKPENGPELENIKCGETYFVQVKEARKMFHFTAIVICQCISESVVSECEVYVANYIESNRRMPGHLELSKYCVVCAEQIETACCPMTHDTGKTISCGLGDTTNVRTPSVASVTHHCTYNEQLRQHINRFQRFNKDAQANCIHYVTHESTIGLEAVLTDAPEYSCISYANPSAVSIPTVTCKCAHYEQLRQYIVRLVRFYDKEMIHLIAQLHAATDEPKAASVFDAPEYSCHSNTTRNCITNVRSPSVATPMCLHHHELRAQIKRL